MTSAPRPRTSSAAAPGAVARGDPRGSLPTSSSVTRRAMANVAMPPAGLDADGLAGWSASCGVPPGVCAEGRRGGGRWRAARWWSPRGTPAAGTAQGRAGMRLAARRRDGGGDGGWAGGRGRQRGPGRQRVRARLRPGAACALPRGHAPHPLGVPPSSALRVSYLTAQGICRTAFSEAQSPALDAWAPGAVPCPYRMRPAPSARP